MREVAFKEFAAVAKKRGLTVESLADRFRGKIENPSEFFERVMTCKYADPLGRSRICKRGSLQVVDFPSAKPGQKRVMATSVLTDQFREI